MLRRLGGRQRQHGRERKTRAATGRAGDGQVAAHQLGQIFDHGEAESGAAIAARDVGACLRERTEQPLDLGAREPDAAVGDGEDKFHAPACGARRARFKPDDALCREFHRVVDEVFQRGAQPHRIAYQQFGQIVRDRHLGIEAFRLRPRGERICQNLDQTQRPKNLLLERERARFGFGGVDHQRRQRGQMLRAGLDARGPAPLAFAEIGACQQFAEREDAGERRADIVGERRERGLGRADARLRRRVRRRAGRAADFFFFFLLFGRQSRHGSPPAPRPACHGAARNKISAGAHFY